MITEYHFRDKVHLRNDIMGSIKPWDTGEVMVQDGEECLVCWHHSWGDEYAWVSIQQLEKVD